MATPAPSPALVCPRIVLSRAHIFCTSTYVPSTLTCAWYGVDPRRILWYGRSLRFLGHSTCGGSFILRSTSFEKKQIPDGPPHGLEVQNITFVNTKEGIRGIGHGMLFIVLE